MLVYRLKTPIVFKITLYSVNLWTPASLLTGCTSFFSSSISYPEAGACCYFSKPKELGIKKIKSNTKLTINFHLFITSRTVDHRKINSFFIYYKLNFLYECLITWTLDYCGGADVCCLQPQEISKLV